MDMERLDLEISKNGKNQKSSVNRLIQEDEARKNGVFTQESITTIKNRHKYQRYDSDCTE